MVRPDDAAESRQAEQRGIVAVEGLQGLIDALVARGYRVMGPQARYGAIVYDDLERADELPIGWADAQSPGHYRLVERDDAKRFGYTVAPQGWRRELLPPTATIFEAERNGVAFSPRQVEYPTERRAFLGVRPCELAAIEIQDRVFRRAMPNGDVVNDALYASRREGVFTVAVNCGDPAGTCFCASMDTGPRADGGYDLALTEIVDGEHRFLVEAGSTAGAEVFADLGARPATDDDLAAATAVTDAAAQRMGRELETDGIKELLYGNLEHPRFDEVAKRCLACGNCTLVCPTCFCTTVVDVNDVTGTAAHRERVWDTCFSVGYSYIHGGSIRTSVKSRYRQWLTHKLASWIDQFGTSGCVGCGRCITWCPVGIDITEEAAAIRADDRRPTTAEALT